jgi:antibiotic biosynthesis monooxygenase (ABM) superfamily enzyme
MVTHRVPPEHIDEFLSRKERIRLAENRFPGYRGSEMFRPVEGAQQEWTTLYRYDSAADLDRWLTSTERKQLLDEGKKFSDFRLRTIDSSFGNWFTFDDGSSQVRPPSTAKTSIAVWFGLYPTAMLLGLALSPARLPMWQGTLIGTLLSSFVMSCVTMPFYVNRLLKRWLQPGPGVPKAANNIRAVLSISTAMVFWAVLFWLVTAVFWKLP